jgi:adenylyl cyclase-associated protein
MSDALLPLLQDILARLGNIEANLNISSTGGGSASGTAEVPRSIRAFDAYAAEKLDPFVAACTKLGGDAATLGQFIKESWMEMRLYLLRAAACKEPTPLELPSVFGPVAARIRDANAMIKRNEWEKHAKTCAEGVQALNWLVVKPAPRDFVETYVGGSDYWANNIRREFKATNPDQVAFCDTFKQLLLGLMDYIKEYHTTGVAWNPKGMDVSDYSGSAATAPVSAPAAAPAPAPAPAPAAASAPAASASKPAAVGGNLFSELNKGGNITSGLKTVTKDMQTWRSEYKSDAPAVAAAPKKAPAVSSANAGPKGPPKMEFQAAGNKWVVENQSDANGPIEITINDLKESVYAFGCVGATINVSGKCKSVIVDSCKKTKVYFDNAFASCEVVNCQRMQVHCRVAVGSVAIDKTDGIVVFLPETSLDSKIVASKSSEMNLTWPDAAGNMIERPIPEQYVHQVNAARDGITADVSDLYGH